MSLFLTSVLLVLIVSAICSLSEAAFYAVRIPYVRRLAESGGWAGKTMAKFKENMERPIAAILIVNTIANTAGAAIAGSQARHLFGESSILWFSALFTLAVLFFSEIIPKVAGVAYSQPVARLMAVPWMWIIAAIYPMIWLIEKVVAWIKPNAAVVAAPEEEVEQMAMMSAEEGSIMNYEAELVKNVLGLDNIIASEIMIPRAVVQKLEGEMTLREVHEQHKKWVHSRIPVYSRDDPETWTGYVLTRSILTALAQDKFDQRLSELAKPLYFVAEDVPGHVLLKSFLRRKSHLFGVTNQYGDITGIISLEDVMESLLGEEIVDEVDMVADMQDVALRRKQEHYPRDDDSLFDGESETP